MAKFIELQAVNGQLITFNLDHIIGFTKRNENQTGILTSSASSSALVKQTYEEVKKLIES